MLARDRRLFRRAHRANHGRAQMMRPLAHDQSDAAGSGVDQNGVAMADGIRSANEILRGQALQKDCCGGFVIERVWQFDQTRGIHDAQLTVRAG